MLEYVLQPATKLKTPLQILFLKRSGRNECSKISKIPEKCLQNCSFSLTVCSPEFLNSGKKDPKKNASFQCSEIDLSNPPTDNRTEADSAAKISRECFENF